MEYTLIAELNKKNLLTYLLERQFGNDLLFPNFFPLKDTPFLSFETLIGSKGNPVAADVVTYDASSPLKSRKTVNKLTGSLPPIRIKRKMKESDLNTYNVLKAQAAAGSDVQLLDFIFEDVDFCVDGVLARIEWLVLQAFSQGYVAMTKSTNNGVITADNIDFQMPAANKRKIKSATATRVWDNATAGNPKPLTDIEVIAEAALTAGIILKYALMTRATWHLARKTTEVIQSVLNSTTAGRKPTLAETNAYLFAQDLPQIVLVDSYIDIENDDGTISSVNCWVTKYVTFVPFLNVGNTLSGPIAAETNPPKQATQVKRDRVLVQKYSETDPVAEYTVGMVNAFPTWPTVDRCYRFSTTDTPEADGLDD